MTSKAWRCFLELALDSVFKKKKKKGICLSREIHVHYCALPPTLTFTAETKRCQLGPVRIPTDTTWLRRDVTAFSDLPEVDVLLIVSSFSKFWLLLPSVFRLVSVCFKRAVLGAAFGGVLPRFEAVFESFLVVFETAWRTASWPVNVWGLVCVTAVVLDWSVWSSLFGLTCVVVIVGLICVIVNLTVLKFFVNNASFGDDVWFFPAIFRAVWHSQLWLVERQSRDLACLAFSSFLVWCSILCVEYYGSISFEWFQD